MFHSSSPDEKDVMRSAARYVIYFSDPEEEVVLCSDVKYMGTLLTLSIDMNIGVRCVI